MRDFLRFAWREERPALLALAVVGAVMVYVIYGTSSTSIKCVERGYPEYRVSWTLERYCIKRVNQTDIVVRLDSLERGR